MDVGTGSVEAALVPEPSAVEVVEQERAIYLLRLDKEGACIADTWHETVDDAKAQANFEFGIEESDWKDIDQRH